MKKIFLSVVLTVAVTLAFGQDSKKVFSTNEIVWYGLDFTKAKFIGAVDKGAEVKNKYVPQWNALIVKEQNNFDFRKAFQKDDIYYDVEPINTVNSKMDAAHCIGYNPGKIEKADVAAMVKNYPIGEKKEGTACVFVIENFNKTLDVASMYVTFFDIATKKVLLCEKMEGKPIGVGVRNYWAGAIKNVIKQMEESAWSRWSK